MEAETCECICRRVELFFSEIIGNGLPVWLAHQ